MRPDSRDPILGTAWGKPLPPHTPVFFYARTSSDKQEEMVTIAAQLDEQKAFAERMNLTWSGTYIDDGVTGDTPISQRPGGAALLAALDALPPATYALIYFWRVDRLGRETYITLEAENQILKRRGLVRSVTQTFDITEDFGRYMFNTLASQSGYEKSGIITRMTAGSRAWARRGAWTGGVAPYGYHSEARNNRHYLVPDERPILGVDKSPAELVKWMYETVAAEGVSCNEIARRLAAMNVPTCYSYRNRKGAEKDVWRNSTVYHILKQTVYKGLYEYGKRSRRTDRDRELIPMEVPAIVTPELWADVQMKLSQNQLEATRSAKNQYLLRGLITCGLCGSGFHGSVAKGRLRYICNGYISKYAEHAPGGLRSPRCLARVGGDLEETVWSEIERFLANPQDEIIARLRIDDSTAQVPVWQAEMKALQNDLDAKDAERMQVFRGFRMGLMNDDDVALQIAEIDGQKATLQKLQQNLRDRIDAASATARQRESAIALLSDVKGFLSDPPTWEEKHRVVKALVKSITIRGWAPEGRLHKHKRFQSEVTVTYRFDTPDDERGAASWL